MVSSTFTDLKEHRLALIEAIHQHKLHANVMENDSARLVDVIDSSLCMVHDSAAYIGVISLKYGQTPQCRRRNPNELSITELEFNEALHLGCPILLFIMGEDHPVTKADIEKDPVREAKLNAFRERAKQMSPESSVHRVYATFNSLEEFKDKIAPSLAELSRHLELFLPGDFDDAATAFNTTKPIPKPPAFYAEPDYIGSHRFVGRQAELDVLSDWANAADPTNLLLFEAIGGNGKSMLTWEWTTKCATRVRTDWAGCFWYSFYEKGAILTDFCRRALAYMTARPVEEFTKRKTAEMAEDLLAQLHAKPWLLILDGVERLLVAYHRIDAAEVSDEEANAPEDKIAKRNPCDAIREEDNNLLRSLASARPSKILISSRLAPRVLLNPSGQTIPGARRIDLPGLRPADAEALLRSCGREKDSYPGLRGDSAAIQAYLTAYCDNHPLVIGVLGGLINNYLPDRGNFDAWVADPDGGATLDLASLDLVQSRNHILRAALDALSPESRQLLSTLALLSESADYDTVKAFNPHLPVEPEEVEKPELPEERWDWEWQSDEMKAERRMQYEVDLARRDAYERAVQARLASSQYRAALRKLTETVRDLEQRGLVQWNGRDRKYNLHPVVRRVTAGAMNKEDTERYGQRVVDYFSSLPHDPYEHAETLENLRPGLHLVRTLIRMGRYQQAAHEFRGAMAHALYVNVDAHQEVLSLLRPLFPERWATVPTQVDQSDAGYLANSAGNALDAIGSRIQAVEAFESALKVFLQLEDWVNVGINLNSLAATHKRLAVEERCLTYAIALAELDGNKALLFSSRSHLWSFLNRTGRWKEADTIWTALNATKDNDSDYPKGFIELAREHQLFLRGDNNWDCWPAIEELVKSSKSAFVRRIFHSTTGTWRLEQGEWAPAAASFAEALRMARESGISDPDSETGLALSKHHLGQLSEPQQEAERLTELREPAYRLLAQLWLALGDHEKAKEHALAAYKQAWADGEPYVNRYMLSKTTELLQQLNVPIPKLPPYDATKEEPIPWEADVRAAIEKLRAEKEVESRDTSSRRTVGRDE